MPRRRHPTGGCPPGVSQGDTTPRVPCRDGGSCQSRRVSTRRRGTRVPALLAAAALLVAGCGSEDDGEPAASTGSIATETAAPDGTDDGTDGGTDDGTDGGTDDGTDSGTDGGDAPPFPSDVQPDQQDASGDALVTVTDIRTGRHDGFDRVVFEVDGEGVPGWDVRYVDDPVSQGSGDPVEVSGEAVLQVTVTGAGYPYDTGVEEFAANEPVAGPGAVVTEVVFDATFEGTSEAFIGTTGESPFRAYLLEGPTRIVVEVADPT
jgi:hypothetical protein